MLNSRGQISENKNVKFLIAPICKNRKAQISETMTWVVATTAIIVILVLSISIVNLGFKEKSFKTQGGTSDLLVTKSFMGYLGNIDNSELKICELELGKKLPSGTKNLGDSNAKLAKDIFPILYSKGTSSSPFWLGFVGESCLKPKCNPENELGDRKDIIPGKAGDESVIYETLKLNNGIFELLVKIKK